MTNNICVYHGNCIDGFTSAFIVNNALKGKCIFEEAFYNKKMSSTDFTGKTVYLVDYSWEYDQLVKVANVADKVIIIDHHISAYEELTSNDLPDNVSYVYNNEKCGAMLVYEYFFPNEEIPLIINYVNDQDMWKNELPFTKEFSSAIRIKEKSFAVWEELVVEDLIRDGDTLLKYESKLVEEHISNHRVVNFNKGFNKGLVDLVPIKMAFAPQSLSSEVGNILAEDHEFGVVFTIRPEHVKVSLRSKPGKTDVCEIAKTFGGGGHTNASGFILKTSEFKMSSLENLFT